VKLRLSLLLLAALLAIAATDPALLAYPATLVRVKDGDTVVLNVVLADAQNVRTWSRGQTYRLARIDAPESNERRGPMARDSLRIWMINAQQLTVAPWRGVWQQDSWGRWIVEIMADGRNLNDSLVTSGLAVYRSY